MRIDADDYVLFRDTQQNNKIFTMRVSSAGEENVKGILEFDRHITDTSVVKVARSNIICNLGEKPYAAQYPVDARDFYRKTVTHKSGWGDIHFFIKPAKPLLAALGKSLDKTATRMDAKGFSPVFDLICTEVRNFRGKYAGEYKHNGRNGVNRLRLFLKDDHATEMDYVLYHELGHAIRYNYVSSSKARSHWLRLFNLSNPVDGVSEKDFRRLFKDLRRSQAQTIAEFASGLEELDQPIFKTILRYIAQTRKVPSK